MRITCDRCGKDRMLSETHAARRDLPIRDIIKRNAPWLRRATVPAIAVGSAARVAPAFPPCFERD